LEIYTSEKIFNIKQKIIEKEKNISSDKGGLFFGNIVLSINFYLKFKFKKIFY
jgi:hypothetical protein